MLHHPWDERTPDGLGGTPLRYSEGRGNPRRYHARNRACHPTVETSARSFAASPIKPAAQEKVRGFHEMPVVPRIAGETRLGM
jgi:hypothetical protein